MGFFSVEVPEGAGLGYDRRSFEAAISAFHHVATGDKADNLDSGYSLSTQILHKNLKKHPKTHGSRANDMGVGGLKASPRTPRKSTVPPGTPRGQGLGIRG